MDKIAETAGVSKRTVYNHFCSKEGLFDEIVNLLFKLLSESVDATYTPGAPLEPQLVHLIEQKMALYSCSKFLRLSKMVMAELIHRPEKAHELACNIEKRQHGVLVWIDAACEDGKLTIQDTKFASHQLEGLIKSFAYWPQISIGKPTLTEQEQKMVAESSAKMFLAYYAN